ncbi:uncharacterized protein LOC130703305 [Daphnia carinata]|uniref:uncharacterized protein LOC130703305 n=1 Tax=Daphnia carinata TaxID=120202 RepID=UPI00257B705D|nr:uncharacterized protein LOC130703305 [Daphnia carinata]
MDRELQEAVANFWLTESFGVRPLSQTILAPDEMKALRILENTVRHTGERYEVGLMLRHQDLQLPNNREVAARRFQALEKRFQRDPQYDNSYSRVIEEYISLGHPKLSDTMETNNPIWYLPHHGVTTPNKPGKVRVVFNQSARHKGTSLNEHLFKGPDLLTPMIGVLFRFRRLPVPISGGIKKMFHQMLVPPQQSLLRFLWKPIGSSGPPKTYRMSVHVFGAVSSPTSCIFALRKTTEDFGPKFPTVDDLIVNTIYVDNYLGCTETEQEAITRRRDVTALLNWGGFNMVQWLSSSRSVVDSVHPADRSRSLDPNPSHLPTERTLGLLWDCEGDCFCFKSAVRIKASTKRQLLQDISTVYDPLGFLTPIVITAKIFMQDIWRVGVDWDDPLPSVLLTAWSLCALPAPYLHRRLGRSSTKAFGACIYVRADYGTDVFPLHLVLAKGRVAPLRQFSIPRLELQGALLGARLCFSVVKELGNITSKIVYWCDSQTVLQWIHSTTRKYHAFVAHRVSEILESSSSDQWRHVPGELNPADECSCGVSSSHFTTQHRWFRGPDLLSLPETAWPFQFTISEPPSDDPEVSSNKWVGSLLTPTVHPLYNLIQNTSNLTRLKRIVAWLARFATSYSNTSNHLPRVGSRYLTAQELRDAWILIQRVDQEHHFFIELSHLRRHKPVPVTSKFGKLTPFIDVRGLLRVGGTLQHASLPEESKHPAILSNSSQLAKMIILELHCNLGHASTERTIHALRSQYHVLKTRDSTHRLINRCFACQVRKGKPEPPLMAPLPATRLKSYLPPFNYTGVDFFGPMTTILLRRSMKRYGVLFTCLDCRAVHIEIASSLDVDSFLVSFARFVDRRGLPKVCYSGNGTNLISGEQELQTLLSRWEPEVLINKMAARDFEWRFSPPAASHFGRTWENLIKSAKTALRAILHERTVTEEVLTTAMTEVEALLNARPLTYVSVESQ